MARRWLMLLSWMLPRQPARAAMFVARRRAARYERSAMRRMIRHIQRARAALTSIRRR